MPNNSVSPLIFQKFDKAAFDFLAKLKKNNRRPWFQKHKAEFEQHLLVPIRAFAEALASSLQSEEIPVSTNAKAPVSRIYRDLRFTPDKRPYNTFMSTALTRRGNKESPGVVYVHLAAGDSFAALGFWHPEAAFLQAWRAAMAEQPKKFEHVLAQLKRKKLKVNVGGGLQRLPSGHQAQAGGTFEPYFKLKSFVVSRPLSVKETCSPKLVEVVTDFAVAAKPLLDFGWSLDARHASSATDFLD